MNRTGFAHDSTWRVMGRAVSTTKSDKFEAHLPFVSEGTFTASSVPFEPQRGGCHTHSVSALYLKRCSLRDRADLTSRIQRSKNGPCRPLCNARKARCKPSGDKAGQAASTSGGVTRLIACVRILTSQTALSPAKKIECESRLQTGGPSVSNSEGTEVSFSTRFDTRSIQCRYPEVYSPSGNVALKNARYLRSGDKDGELAPCVPRSLRSVHPPDLRLYD